MEIIVLWVFVSASHIESAKYCEWMDIVER